MRHVRILLIALAVGSGSGLVIGGVGGRLAMRALAILAPSAIGKVTDSGAVVGTITLPGTVEVMRSGVINGILGALLYLALRGALPLGPVPRAAAYAGLAAVFATGVQVMGNGGDFRFLPVLLAVPLFMAVFAAYGAVAATAIDRLTGPFTRYGRRGRLLVYGVAAVAAAGDVVAIVTSL